MKRNRILLFISICVFQTNFILAAQEMSLEQALGIVATQNPKVIEARQRVKIAEALYKQTRKLDNPEMEVEVGKLLYDLENESRYDEKLLEGGVGFSQPLKTWGKRKLTINIAKDEWMQAENEFQETWLDVVRQVKEQYTETLLHQKSIELAKDNLERAQRLFEQVNIQFNSGKARNHELARSKLELANAKNGYLEADNNFILSIGQLNILLGRDMDEDIQLKDYFAPTEIKRGPEDLLQSALSNRADILNQDIEVAKKGKQLKLAKRQRLPDVNFGLFVEREEEIYSAGAGLSFELPIWHQFQGEIKEADLEKQIAEMNLTALKREVELEVYMAYKNVDLARKSVNNLQEAIKEANELLRIITVEYEEGEATFLSYLEGLASYRETKQHYLESLADYSNKLAILEQSIGGNLDLKEEE